jgi:hypothetical protein
MSRGLVIGLIVLILGPVAILLFGLHFIHGEILKQNILYLTYKKSTPIKTVADMQETRWGKLSAVQHAFDVLEKRGDWHFKNTTAAFRLKFLVSQRTGEFWVFLTWVQLKVLLITAIVEFYDGDVGFFCAVQGIDSLLIIVLRPFISQFDALSEAVGAITNFCTALLIALRVTLPDVLPDVLNHDTVILVMATIATCVSAVRSVIGPILAFLPTILAILSTAQERWERTDLGAALLATLLQEEENFVRLQLEIPVSHILFSEPERIKGNWSQRILYHLGGAAPAQACLQKHLQRALALIAEVDQSEVYMKARPKNSTLNLYAEVRNATLGLKWEEIGSEKPQTGSEIINAALAKALEVQKEFTQEQFDQFQVSDLTESSYIQVDNVYLRPTAGLDEQDLPEKEPGEDIDGVEGKSKEGQGVLQKLAKKAGALQKLAKKAGKKNGGPKTSKAASGDRIDGVEEQSGPQKQDENSESPLQERVRIQKTNKPSILRSAPNLPPLSANHSSGGPDKPSEQSPATRQSGSLSHTGGLSELQKSPFSSSAVTERESTWSEESQHGEHPGDRIISELKVVVNGADLGADACDPATGGSAETDTNGGACEAEGGVCIDQEEVKEFQPLSTCESETAERPDTNKKGDTCQVDILTDLGADACDPATGGSAETNTNGGACEAEVRVCIDQEEVKEFQPLSTCESETAERPDTNKKGDTCQVDILIHTDTQNAAVRAIELLKRRNIEKVLKSLGFDCDIYVTSFPRGQSEFGAHHVPLWYLHPLCASACASVLQSACRRALLFRDKSASNSALPQLQNATAERDINPGISADVVAADQASSRRLLFSQVIMKIQLRQLPSLCIQAHTYMHI